jgi:hypothetical protein
MIGLVTDSWLAESPLDPLTGSEGVAERLVLILHNGVDFEIWGGARRVRYWDALTERVKAATYSGPTLSHWWGDVCRQIVSSPRDHAVREEVATLLAAGNQREVLNALRTHAEVLVLRTRVVSEYRKQARNEDKS